MKRIGELDIVQKLGTLAVVSGSIYPGLHGRREAVVEIEELRSLVEAAERDQRDRTRH